MNMKQLIAENAALRREIEKITDRIKWATSFGIRLDEENQRLRQELGMLQAEFAYKEHVVATKEIQTHKPEEGKWTI